MDNIIDHKNRSYVILPNDNKMLHVKFSSPYVFRHDKDMAFQLDEIVSRGIDTKRSDDGTTVFRAKKDSVGLYWFKNVFCRDDIDPLKVGNYSGHQLDEYLRSERGIDLEHELVLETADKIKYGMSPTDRNNAYLLGSATIDWIKDNIEYISVPNSLIDNVAFFINYLGNKASPYKILRNSFNLNDGLIRIIASNCTLKKGMSSKETAKDLMEQANQVSKIFQLFWLTEEITAGKTLEEKSGKCVGIARTYVALLRAMGIPSKTIGGYFGDNYGIFGGNHVWATLYIPEYGWKEVDPTLGEYKDFSFDFHAYSFYDKEEDNSHNFEFIGTDESNLLVNDVISLVKSEKRNRIAKARNGLNFIDRYFKTSKFRKTESLEAELMKDELEYLERFC